MYSLFHLNQSIIPNRIERFEDKNFIELSKDDYEVVKRPDEISDTHLADEAAKWMIASNGSYNLSPFCVVINSDVNTVELDTGETVKWSELLKPENSHYKFKDTYGTYTSVKEISYNGKKEARRYITSCGTAFDVTPEHRFSTIVNDQIVEIPIQEIYERDLPLLRAIELNGTDSKSPSAYYLHEIISWSSLGEQEVADIMVSNESHTYLLNGFLQHNSFNWNHARDIYTVLSIFKQYTHDVSLSSCRIDALSKDKDLAKLIMTFGATNLTVAVEGISERIRNYLAKSLSDEEQYVGLMHAISSGFRSMKFYYIYTGKETTEDIVRFQAFLRALEEVRKLNNKQSLKIRFSFTPLLSTTGTPTQYHGASIQRSLKLEDKPLMRIRQAISRAGFDVRLSTPIPISDFSQIMEFSDRRSAPLLEYASLCGLSQNPFPGICFVTNPVKVTKAEFAKLESHERYQDGKDFYKADKLVRMSFEKLYNNLNASHLHPVFHEQRIIKTLIEYEHKELPQEFIEALPAPWCDLARGTQTFLQWQEGLDHRHTFENGKKFYGFVVNMSMAQTQADKYRTLLPMFTGGQTFEDICCDKNAMWVLPGDHIRFHENRHLGWNFKLHVENRAFLHNSYCYSRELSTSLDEEETKLFVSIDDPDNQVVPHIQDNREKLNSGKFHAVYRCYKHRFDEQGEYIHPSKLLEPLEPKD